MPHQTLDRSTLSPKWQFAFHFFDKHGGPRSPTFKPAFMALSFSDRLRVHSNLLACIFGGIYFLSRGMWRKAIVLLGLQLIVLEVVLRLPDPYGLGLWIGTTLGIASTTNYGYYLHRVHGSRSWNPFEGVRWW